jgi:hypothetical protein
MSVRINYLHSHSGIERELCFPKNTVLIDKKYEHLFEGEPHTLFIHKGVEYYKVNILSFVKKGGVFKNLRA